MSIKRILISSFALWLSAVVVQAQDTNQVEKLENQLKQLQEKFEKQQQEMRENFERLLREQQAQIEALKNQITATTNATVASPPKTTDEMEELNKKVDSVIEAQKKVRPGEFNPAIGLVGETIFSYRSRSSTDTGSDRPGGFNAFQRSVELNVAASVDPFAKAYAVINASADAATGEAT